MRAFKISLFAIVGLFLLLALLNALPVAPGFSGDNIWRVEEGGRPMIIPHGGAKELYPENTVYSYEMLYQKEYDVFEIDLCLTADNRLITHHDIDIYSTTGQEGVRIIDKKYEELLEYNFARNFVNLEGEKPYTNVSDHVEKGLIPANLESLFEKYPDMLYILEIKDTVDNSGEEVFIVAVDVLIDLIIDYNMQDKVIMASFDDEVVYYFRERSDNRLMTGSGLTKSTIFVALSMLNLDFFYKPKDAALMLPIKDEIREPFLSTVKRVPAFLRNYLFYYDDEDGKYYTDVAREGIVNDAHRHNMAIFYWTVNDKETMRKLINMNVDGIITDRPDIMRELLEEMGFQCNR